MIKCSVCGNKFKPTTNFSNPKKYCSRRCKDKAYWNNIGSEQKRKYKKTYDKEHRAKLRKKPCIKCQAIPTIGHHILPKEFNGSDTEKIRLCHSCHFKIHKLYTQEIIKYIPTHLFRDAFNNFLKR